MVVKLLHHLVRYRFRELGFHSRIRELTSCRLHYLHRQGESSKHAVFIHGLGTSSSTWIRILPRLQNSHAITCIDLPGHGFSKIHSGDQFFTLEQLDNTIEQFIFQIQQSPITLIGHSLGGWLAARYAIRHPDFVNHLILINNAGIQYPGFEQQADTFNLQNADALRTLLDRMWYHYPSYFKPLLLSIYKSLKEKHIDEFIASIRREDFLNFTFGKIAIPIDVIWGKEDKLISIDSLDIMQKLAPHMQVHVIPHCSHVPQLEQPAELASLLNRILI